MPRLEGGAVLGVSRETLSDGSSRLYYAMAYGYNIVTISGDEVNIQYYPPTSTFSPPQPPPFSPSPPTTPERPPVTPSPPPAIPPEPIPIISGDVGTLSMLQEYLEGFIPIASTDGLEFIEYLAITNTAPAIGCTVIKVAGGEYASYGDPTNVATIALAELPPAFKNSLNVVTTVVREDIIPPYVEYPYSWMPQVAKVAALNNPALLSATIVVTPALLFTRHDVGYPGTAYGATIEHTYPHDIYVLSVRSDDPIVKEIMMDSPTKIKIYQANTKYSDYAGQTLPTIEVPIKFTLKADFLSINNIDGGSDSGVGDSYSAYMVRQGVYTIVCQTSEGDLFELKVDSACYRPLYINNLITNPDDPESSYYDREPSTVAIDVPYTHTVGTRGLVNIVKWKAYFVSYYGN
jgi:hypothetical protein